MQQALEKTQPDQRALLQQLSYGTLRGYFRLEAILAQLLKKPLKRKDRELYCLLLCGLHQLLDMRTPDHAAISTSVDACRVLGKNWATGLVNGVLRRASREKETLLANLTRCSARFTFCGLAVALFSVVQFFQPSRFRLVLR